MNGSHQAGSLTGREREGKKGNERKGRGYAYIPESLSTVSECTQEAARETCGDSAGRCKQRCDSG